MQNIIDENLIRIFTYLDTESLINASLVCRRWEALISNSMYLMRNFDILVTKYLGKFIFDQIIPNGKYQKLTFDFDGPSKPISDRIIQKIASNSKYLKNISLKYVNRQMSIQIISVLPNITKLIISDCRFDAGLNTVIDMPNLKHLELNNSLIFAEVIGCNKIKVLKIFRVFSDVRKPNLEHTTRLNTLLHQCNGLKELTISDVQIADPTLSSMHFTFQLESLTIEKFNFNEDNLVNFLTQQKNSLKKLTIVHKRSNRVIPKVIFQQLSLEELEIDVNSVSKTFQLETVNSTIKKLTIRSIKHSNVQQQRNRPLGHNVDLALFYIREAFRLRDAPLQLQDPDTKLRAEKLILTCRALQSVRILDMKTDSLLELLSSTQNDLKILKLQEIPATISPKIHFDKLEVLEIDKIENLRDPENLTFLVLYCPNLHTLKINSFLSTLFDSKIFITIINKAQKLRKLHIGTKCLFSLDMIKAVKLMKFRGRPLQVLSFDHCSVCSVDKDEFNDMFLEDLKLNFHQNSTKFFESMCNESELGRMKREIDKKCENIKQQSMWSNTRRQVIEKKFSCKRMR